MIAQTIISTNRVHAGSICCSFRSLVVAHGRHHVRTRHTVSHRLRAFSMQTNDANAPQKDPPRKLPPVKRITREDVTIQFARSSGAGGQNVNKVNTKVDMRLHLGNASWLDREIADAVRRMEKKRINKDDELVVMSQRTRSQLGNIEDALIKIQEILDDAHKSTLPIEEDPEKKKQIETQLKKGNETRLKKKQMKGDKKKERRSGKNIKDW